MMMRLRSIAFALLLGQAAFAPPVLAQSGCLGPGEINKAIRAGQALSLDQILAIAAPGAKPITPLVACFRGGQLYFEIGVIKNGSPTKITVNALTGRP